MTAPTIAVEILAPITGVFVLDRSAIGSTDLLGGGATAGLEWLDITDGLQSLNMTRGAQRDGITTTVQVGNLTATFKDTVDPVTNPATFRPGMPIRALETTTGETLWTGVTSDIGAYDDKITKALYATITALDHVAQLAGQTRIGVAHPTADHEPWTDRINRLLGSSGVPYEPVPPVLDGTTLWTHTGHDEFGLWSGSPTKIAPDLLNFTTLAATRNLTGLTPGTRYRISCAWFPAFGGVTPGVPPTINPVGLTIDTGDVATITSATVDIQYLSLEFFATATTHVLTVNCATTPLNLKALTLASVGYVPQAANHLQETNNAAHVDIAATSAGVAWFVNRFGVASIVKDPTAAILHASDVAAPADPLYLSYTSLASAFSTGAIVNDLTLTNLVRAWDEENEEWVSADTTFGPIVDLASAATWGARTGAATTAIYTGPTYPFTDGLQRLTRAILTDSATPEVAFEGITINSFNEDAALIGPLDCYQTVTVTNKGVTQNRRIRTITHDVTPYTWITIIELTEA